MRKLMGFAMIGACGLLGCPGLAQTPPPSRALYGVLRADRLDICGERIPIANVAAAAERIRAACSKGDRRVNRPAQSTDGLIVFFDPGSMALVGTGRPSPRPNRDLKLVRQLTESLRSLHPVSMTGAHK